MKTIAFVNSKGGVGKTTSALNTAAALAELGHRTLVIDLDPHGGLSKKFGINPSQLDRSIFQFLSEPDSPHPLKDFVMGTAHSRIDIIPGHRDLEALDRVLVEQEDIYPYAFTRENDSIPERRNAGMLAFQNVYEYVIIDTQPRYSPLVISALHASDLCVLPFIPEIDTAEAFTELQQTLEDDIIKPGGLPYRILFTMVQERTAHHSVLMTTIRDMMPGQVFNSVVRRSIAVADSHSKKGPIVLINKKHPVAENYRQFAEELLTYVHE